MEPLEQDNSIFEPRYGFAIEAIDALDLTKQAYIESCEILVKNNTDPDVLDLICNEASLYTSAYEDTLTALLVDTPLPEFSTIGTTLIIEQDRARIKQLNSLLGRTALAFRQTFDPPQLQPVLGVGPETIKLSLRTGFSKLFTNDVFVDTTNFVRQVMPAQGA